MVTVSFIPHIRDICSSPFRGIPCRDEASWPAAQCTSWICLSHLLMSIWVVSGLRLLGVLSISVWAFVFVHVFYFSWGNAMGWDDWFISLVCLFLRISSLFYCVEIVICKMTYIVLQLLIASQCMPVLGVVGLVNCKHAIGYKWYLIVVLLYISWWLIGLRIYHVISHHVSSLVKCLIKSFSCFLFPCFHYSFTCEISAHSIVSYYIYG